MADVLNLASEGFASVQRGQQRVGVHYRGLSGGDHNRAIEGTYDGQGRSRRKRR